MSDDREELYLTVGVVHQIADGNTDGAALLIDDLIRVVGAERAVMLTAYVAAEMTDAFVQSQGGALDRAYLIDRLREAILAAEP